MKIGLRWSDRNHDWSQDLIADDRSRVREAIGIEGLTGVIDQTVGDQQQGKVSLQGQRRRAMKVSLCLETHPVNFIVR